MCLCDIFDEHRYVEELRRVERQMEKRQGEGNRSKNEANTHVNDLCP